MVTFCLCKQSIKNVFRNKIAHPFFRPLIYHFKCVFVGFIAKSPLHGDGINSVEMHSIVLPVCDVSTSQSCQAEIRHYVPASTDGIITHSIFPIFPHQPFSHQQHNLMSFIMARTLFGPKS